MQWTEVWSDFRKNILALMISSAPLLLLAGCGSAKDGIVVVEKMPYERIEHATTEVKRGNIKPSVTVSIQVGGYTEKEYGMTNKSLKLDKVYVSVGDHVRQGDVLVAFQNESLEETIAGYTEKKEQNRLLVEHYSRLMQINPELDYSADIASLEEESRVAQLYIEEAQNRLNAYQIIAQEDGTVIKMNEYLQNGYYVPDRSLLTVLCGEGSYTARTSEPDAFLEGEIYTAQAYGEEYELMLTDIEGESLTFEPVSDMSGVWEAKELTLVVEREAVEDAVYVEAEAVHEVMDDTDTTAVGRYVYVVDDEGFQMPVWVGTGLTVGDYVLITEGLDGGEKVTLE